VRYHGIGKGATRMETEEAAAGTDDTDEWNMLALMSCPEQTNGEVCDAIETC
jgi:hypothetical protein